MSTRKKKPKVIHVCGRLWFQKTNGNTYHTAKVYVDGDLVHEVPKSYGYDRMYLQNAIEWLKDNGYLPKECEALGKMWCPYHGIKLSYTASEVARERDL